MMWVSRAGGVLLILVGVLLLTDYFTVLAGYLQRLTPDALRNRI
jgi:membrane protein YqaA with SNARE-associated domain